MEQVFDVLNRLVNAGFHAGDIPVLGGDFNGCFGLI